jgi:hypothetical protein
MKPPTPTPKRDDKKANKPLITGKNIMDLFITPNIPITGEAMNDDIAGRSTKKS